MFMHRTQWLRAATEGGGGDASPDKKQRVDEEVQKRYRPREVRELLSRYNDDPIAALEHMVEQSNDLVKRLMTAEEGAKFDLGTAQAQIAEFKATVAAITKERDDARAVVQAAEAKQRQGAVAEAMKRQLDGDETLALRTRAYLKLEGYDIDLDGDQIMLTRGEKRHKFATIVNDDFYTTYPDAKPVSDNPLPGGGNPGKRTSQTFSFDADEAAKFYNEQQTASDKLLNDILNPKG